MTENEQEMEYKFTRREIDVISQALKRHINYMKGLMLLNENTYDDDYKAFARSLIREAQALQEKTSYYGQDETYK